MASAEKKVAGRCHSESRASTVPGQRFRSTVAFRRRPSTEKMLSTSRGGGLLKTWEKKEETRYTRRAVNRTECTFLSTKKCLPGPLYCCPRANRHRVKNENNEGQGIGKPIGSGGAGSGPFDKPRFLVGSFIPGAASDAVSIREPGTCQRGKGLVPPSIVGGASN